MQEAGDGARARLRGPGNKQVRTMSEPIAAGPLLGLRVLDLSTAPAAAVCTMLLADLGATVTMIEPDGGSPLRRLPVSRVWLRGKRSLTAVGFAAEPERLARLYSEADVVVFGSPDGAAPLLPLPAPGENPRLVICNAGGPAGSLPGDGDLVAAASGIMGRQPGFRAGPVYVVQPLSSYATALIAAEAIGAALYARDRSGAGDQIEVPLLAGAVQHQGAQLAEIEKPGPLPALRRNAYGQLPLYRLYQCQDGRWLHLGLINARFWPRFCLAIDRPDLISDPRFDAPVRFPTHEQRRALMDIVAEAIVRRPYAEWDRIFDENDVPCAPACTAEEFAHDPQVLVREAVLTVPDHEHGVTRQPGLALHFAGGPVRPASGMPRPGEHDGDPWGTDAGRSAVKSGGDLSGRATNGWDGASSRGPLVGVRVLDLSGYIAGALGPVMLSDLGADVIKVEGPDGDGLRGLHAGFLAWNRGKRGLCVDLRTDAGREIVHKLAREADVLVDNMRPGVADRLGVGYEAMAAINPRLIYCYVSAYGSSGPYRHRPGVDPLMQARSGIERAQGGHEHPPAFLLVPVTDNTCAMLNAAGIALALYQRERTGRGLYFETSLLQAAALVQSDALLSYPERPQPAVNDYDESGLGPLRRLYRCLDGYLFLAAEAAPGAIIEDRWPALCRAIGRADLTADPRFNSAEQRELHRQDLADELIACFAGIPLSEALQRLAEEGVPATEAIDGYAARFHAELSALSSSFVATTVHPVLGRVVQPGVLATFARNPGAVQRTAPLLGEHNDDILRGLGYDDARVTELQQAGVVISDPLVPGS